MPADAPGDDAARGDDDGAPLRSVNRDFGHCRGDHYYGVATTTLGDSGSERLCLLLALVVAAGAQIPAQQLPPGYVDPGPVLAAASKAINEQSLRCITFSGVGYSGPVGQTFENAVNIDWQRSEMANYTRTINWETGTSKETFDRKPGNNPASWKYGLGWVGGTPDAGEPPADAHRERPVRVAHRRRGRACRGSARDGRRVSTRRLAEPARISQGRAHARRQSQGAVAMGADRKGTRRQRRHSRARARRRDYGARKVSRRRDDQQPEHHHAPQGDGERERARRFQHRAGVDRVRAGRAVAVADQLALASRMGRQLAVLLGEHRPQRLRRQVSERAGQRLRRSGSRSRIGEAGAAAEPGARHRGENGGRRVSARRRPREQLHDRVPRLRRGVRSAGQRRAQPRGHRAGREARAEQADSLADQLAPAFRSHRRPAHLQPHRRHGRDAHVQFEVPQPRRADLQGRER